MKAYIKLKGNPSKAVEILKKYSTEILAVVNVDDIVKITMEAVKNNIAVEIVPISSIEENISEKKDSRKHRKQETIQPKESKVKQEKEGEKEEKTVPVLESREEKERMEEVEKELSSVLVKDEYTIDVEKGDEEKEEEEIEYDIEDKKII